MSDFLKASLQDLEVYTPGEQPQDKKYVKLNTNESPFPPSKKVIKSITNSKIRNLRLYCDPECKILRKKLADYYNVLEENIFISNGSDDILNFSFMAFGSDGAAFADITYGFYSVFAKLHGINSTIIPLKNDFTIDIDAFCNQNKLIVLANPNAPTGIEISTADIEKILQSNPNNIVLIDEAYVDFGGTSCAQLIKKYKNLLCVQTFSKSRSMAGARLGFCIADKEIIKDLERIKYSTNPYNINTLTQIAGAKTIDDSKYYLDNCKKIIKNREYTVLELEKIGFSVLPSKANFIFAKNDKIDGKKLYEVLKEKGVLVRHFSNDRIKDYCRITIGSKSEMKTLISKIKEIIGENL